MKDYTITFIEEVGLAELAQAAHEAFAIPLDRIEIWDGEDFAAPATEPVIAQVGTSDGPVPYSEFVGFDAFAEHVGNLDRTTVAVDLVKRVKKRAVLSPASAAEYLWTLVAVDGSAGTVVVDSDRLEDGVIAILGAPEPIPGAPDIRTIDLPDQQ